MIWERLDYPVRNVRLVEESDNYTLSPYYPIGVELEVGFRFSLEWVKYFIPIGRPCYIAGVYAYHRCIFWKNETDEGFYLERLNG